MKKLVSVLLMLALLCGGVAAMAECTHPNGAKVSDNSRHQQVNKVYKNITNETHDRFFDIDWVYYCPDCDSEYTVRETGCSETDEKHDFYFSEQVTTCNCGRKRPCESHDYDKDGVCTVCGYTCDHADSTKRNHGKWLNTVYTNVGSQEYHHAKYDYAEVYDCNTCGAEHYVVIEKGREDNEQHEWILRPEANLDSCSWCGAKKPCDTHTKGATVSTTNGTKTYTSTAAGHVASYTRTTVYTCSSCNWEFSEAETITEAQAAHTFSGSTCTVCKYTCSAHSYVDGVCSVCGNECAHTNAAHNGKGTSKLTSFVDHRDGTHTREFEVWHNYECPTCKHVFEKYIEMGTATEPHEYENGTCHVCGAKPACDVHEKSKEEKVTDGEKTYTTEKDSEKLYHYATYERTTLYSCNACGWLFSETVMKSDPLEKHSFDNGVCTLCKHECVHEYKDGELFCMYCNKQAKTEVKESTIEEALAQEIPPALEEKGIDTVEEVVEALTDHFVAEGYTEEQTEIKDIELVVYVTDQEGNTKPVEVDEKNFPTDTGLEVVFDPPAGTNVNDYTFLVSHLITTGDMAGTVETVETTIREGKIVARFFSLSPVSISWKAKPQTGAALPQTGDDSMLLVWAALLAVSCTALLMKKRSRA